MKRKRWAPKKYLTPAQARKFMAELKRRKRIDFPTPPCDIRGCKERGLFMVSGAYDKPDKDGRVPRINCCRKHRAYAFRKLRLQSRKRAA